MLDIFLSIFDIFWIFLWKINYWIFFRNSYVKNSFFKYFRLRRLLRSGAYAAGAPVEGTRRVSMWSESYVNCKNIIIFRLPAGPPSIWCVRVYVCVGCVGAWVCECEWDRDIIHLCIVCCVLCVWVCEFVKQCLFSQHVTEWLDWHETFSYL